jgi:hypothetical protein
MPFPEQVTHRFQESTLSYIIVNKLFMQSGSIAASSYKLTSMRKVKLFLPPILGHSRAILKTKSKRQIPKSKK